MRPPPLDPPLVGAGARGHYAFDPSFWQIIKRKQNFYHGRDEREKERKKTIIR